MQRVFAVLLIKIGALTVLAAYVLFFAVCINYVFEISYTWCVSISALLVLALTVSEQKSLISKILLMRF